MFCENVVFEAAWAVVLHETGRNKERRNHEKKNALQKHG
jgi:hypothetical protein